MNAKSSEDGWNSQACACSRSFLRRILCAARASIEALILSTLVDLHPEQPQLDERTHQVDCKPLGVAHDDVLFLHPVGRPGRAQPTPPCHSFSPGTGAPLLLARHEGDAPRV